jgi:hypothetical protein
MLKRCYDPEHHNYAYYGGRGITVCDRWFEFEYFVEDILEFIGPKPEGHTLDRIDNSKGYCARNVQWATMIVQNNNRREIKAPRQRGTNYRGVTLHAGKWVAKGSHRGPIYLGRHDTPEDAARAYDTWALQEFGPEYKGFNFPRNVGR